jgi:uncharacterized protein (TIGR03437 family)
VAGGGAALGDNVSATSAYLGEPESVAIDPYGNLYIGDGSGVRKISNGVITTVAGNGTAGYSGDNGPALNAQLSGPAGLAMGSAGNVYVADSYNKRIRVLIPAPPQISLAGIGSAASYKAGQVSPGEIIVVYGNSFGPAALAQMQIANGFVGTTLGNTRIYFDGTPAPMIYAAAGVLSCVVPYEVAGTTQVQVEYSGLKGNTIPVPVVTAVPAIFSLNQSGTGQGAILNQDYSLNGTSNPAASGSVVMVFATGEGKTDLGVDGKITPMAGPWPEPLLQPWTATVGGKASPRIWYAGAAPGNVAGVFQVNMQIPADLTPGMAVLIIKSGGFSSQSVLIVAVK